MYFRSSTRRRFPLQFDLIVINGGTDEIFQSTLINLIALEKIDRSPRVASEARIEELVRIWEARPVGKGKLHLIFVGVADCDYSVVRPHWASHPLPFLDDLPVGLKDALADAGERFATPVCEFCDQLVNTFRWIHWIFMPRIPSFELCRQTSVYPHQDLLQVCKELLPPVLGALVGLMLIRTEARLLHAQVGPRARRGESPSDDTLETIGRPRVRQRFVRLDCQDLTVDSAPVCAKIETVVHDRLESFFISHSSIRCGCVSARQIFSGG